VLVCVVIRKATCGRLPVGGMYHRRGLCRSESRGTRKPAPVDAFSMQLILGR